MIYPVNLFSQPFIQWYLLDTAPSYSSHNDDDFTMYCMGEEL